MLAVLLAVLYGAISWAFSDKLIATPAQPFGTVDPARYGLPKPAVVDVPGNGVPLFQDHAGRAISANEPHAPPG
jgi:hypothetical protein